MQHGVNMDVKLKFRFVVDVGTYLSCPRARYLHIKQDIPFVLSIS